MSTLQRAVKIATQAHAGQIDKGGSAYIDHVLRVMNAMNTEEERIVAALHDVVEDSEWTLDDLRAEKFAPAVIDAVAALTRRKGESYQGFIHRLSAVPLARRVKIRDLEDNMNLYRIAAPSQKDLERCAKYERWRDWLISLARTETLLSADAPKPGDVLGWRPESTDLGPTKGSSRR